MKSKSTKSGFTIIEIVIAISILGIITLLFNNYISQSYKTIKFIEEFNDAVENAKRGMRIMSQELREINVAETGAFYFEIANDYEIVFYSDVDADGQTEKIRYFLNGRNLTKEITEPDYTGTANASIISQYVENQTMAIPQKIFTYLDENNQPLDPINLNNIKLIKIHLEINVTPERAPNNYVIDTNVYLRNLNTKY